MAEFVTLSPIAGQEEHADHIKNDMRRLLEICNNFHDALYGVV